MERKLLYYRLFRIYIMNLRCMTIFQQPRISYLCSCKERLKIVDIAANDTVDYLYDKCCK